jgi:hypothetical protein
VSCTRLHDAWIAASWGFCARGFAGFKAPDCWKPKNGVVFHLGFCRA